MLGIFICFVLPGLLAGLLLSQGSRAASSKARKVYNERQRSRAISGANINAVPDKNRLFVYDLREDFSERETAA